MCLYIIFHKTMLFVLCYTCGFAKRMQPRRTVERLMDVCLTTSTQPRSRWVLVHKGKGERVSFTYFQMKEEKAQKGCSHNIQRKKQK